MTAILAINSGSSTLKFGLFTNESGEEQALLKGSAEGIGKQNGGLEMKDGENKVLFYEHKEYTSQLEALRHVTNAMTKQQAPQPAAIAHRIVHGGPRLREHIHITPQVQKTLEEAVHFAPLHIPTALELLRGAESLYPELPQFACFDTAFHRTMPEEAYRYAVPKEFFEQGLQRYGFHGLSYASIVHQLGSALKPRTVVAHLGSGASLAAIRDGQSIDTSMGLTPTGGIPMGTRTGDLDPGVLLYLARAGHLNADALESLLNHKSGLAALGGTSDMRELQQRASQGDHDAALAITIFCRAIARTIAAFAVSLGGIDQLIFAGGIGEHSSEVRTKVCEQLALLGVTLDADSNAKAQPVISAKNSTTETRIVPSQEEAQMAREVRRLLASGTAATA
jgi:acetate kinase